MQIAQFLDSTYLKTALQAKISIKENEKRIVKCIEESINLNCKLVMIRPKYVKKAKQVIGFNKLLIGTVINFPKGTATIKTKLIEAKKAVKNGAHELDFVLNFSEFKKGNHQIIKNEVLAFANLGISEKKVIKFIIEVAALTNHEIFKIATLIKNTIISNFKEEFYNSFYVKTSTGFFETQNNKPNGATLETIVILLENASPLPVKAAGGIKTLEEAQEMLSLGVKRIGTSSAFEILNKKPVLNLY